ncbi:TIGR03756 family integrating conjugative element protein [Salmonella enterica subsp. salamae]|uniref:TIGR03756 family integrating conjugative element protein n=1 Tax=Salmonella enterica TaxID=28901 RepID=UPI0003BB787F|nr:TIGR03756 family integrating conjugative element protein [Salmonella enterica]EAA6221737.1 TIGR03756 family integrating conjugative element protein [Salmonella enterica subsp. salamae]ECC9759749.1 TIGR03756 family integrating conjugative element protein [Salmonella enterica subsp. salamae]ECG0677139.1 TIGR03756 family integrating conjugative element protein [Salmonella enterica subsp. salamae]EEP4077790.1 TIGR03756 family integrating conjugative element protein [Salmonella enterica subsp. sa
MFRRRLFFIPILCLSSFAQAITTPEIAASALSPECVHYQIVGVCYWLFCSPFGCSVRTSVKVRHFRPNLVVSAYSVTGQNPWTEMSPLSSPLPGIAEAGGDTNPRAVGQHSKVRFKNADAIGFPAGDALANFFSQFGYVCAPSSQPLLPYFLSTLDALAWRSGVPEMFYPEALTPGLREVSKDGDMWGNVYPRAGALSQTHDYKAGAIIAQRVADLVTRSGQSHVYIPLTASSHDGYWPPDPVTEGDSNNHQWQMLVPKKSASCAIFPDSSTTDSYAGKLAEDGAYAWTLWRPYKCCPRRGQTFLGSSGG